MITLLAPKVMRKMIIEVTICARIVTKTSITHGQVLRKNVLLIFVSNEQGGYIYPLI